MFAGLIIVFLLLLHLILKIYYLLMHFMMQIIDFRKLQWFSKLHYLFLVHIKCCRRPSIVGGWHEACGMPHPKGICIWIEYKCCRRQVTDQCHTLATSVPARLLLQVVGVAVTWWSRRRMEGEESWGVTEVGLLHIVSWVALSSLRGDK